MFRSETLCTAGGESFQPDKRRPLLTPGPVQPPLPRSELTRVDLSAEESRAPLELVGDRGSEGLQAGVAAPPGCRSAPGGRHAPRFGFARSASLVCFLPVAWLPPCAHSAQAQRRSGSGTGPLFQRPASFCGGLHSSWSSRGGKRTCWT